MKGTIRSLKRRVKSIRSTQQMTKAMKTVAISKYNRALVLLGQFTPYYKACAALLSDAGGFREDNDSKRGTKACYVALTANRGLCGAYNIDIIRKLKETLSGEEDYCVVMCGRWGQGLCESNRIKNVIRKFDVPDIPDYETAAKLSEYLQKLYVDEDLREVCFVAQDFKNVMSQVPQVNRFLPVSTDGNEEGTDYIFEPDESELIVQLTRRCLDAAVYKYLISAAAGAHGAMLIAMRAAADNSGKMLDELELELNRMRQTAVTTEVIEVASGSLAEHETKGDS